MSASSDSVSRLLVDVRLGHREAIDRLLPIVHGELRQIAAGYMRRERADHTLQPSALVNEAYLRLVNADDLTFESRAHFLGVAARVMRQVLVDHARSRAAAKRTGGATRVPIDEATAAAPAQDVDVLALDEALDRLAQMDPRCAHIVELRFFGGMTAAESAEALSISIATVEREWATARGWLRRQLSRSTP